MTRHNIKQLVFNVSNNVQSLFGHVKFVKTSIGVVNVSIHKFRKNHIHHCHYTRKHNLSLII
jgi:hypothetical protein